MLTQWNYHITHFSSLCSLHGYNSSSGSGGGPGSGVRGQPDEGWRPRPCGLVSVWLHPADRGGPDPEHESQPKGAESSRLPLHSKQGGQGRHHCKIFLPIIKSHVQIQTNNVWVHLFILKRLLALVFIKQTGKLWICWELFSVVDVFHVKLLFQLKTGLLFRFSYRGSCSLTIAAIQVCCDCYWTQRKLYNNLQFQTLNKSQNRNNNFKWF